MITVLSQPSLELKTAGLTHSVVSNKYVTAKVKKKTDHLTNPFLGLFSPISFSSMKWDRDEVINNE